MENGKLISEFECTVCLDLPRLSSKIFQCKSGHLLCQECHGKLEICPTCKKTLGSIRCLVAEKCFLLLSTIETGKLNDLQTNIQGATQGENITRVLLEIMQMERKKERNLKGRIFHYRLEVAVQIIRLILRRTRLRN